MDLSESDLEWFAEDQIFCANREIANYKLADVGCYENWVKISFNDLSPFPKLVFHNAGCLFTSFRDNKRYLWSKLGQGFHVRIHQGS